MIANEIAEPFYGQVRQNSIQDMHGSFHKLQTSYSLYFLSEAQELPPVKKTIAHNDLDSDDDDDETDDEEDGIIISFGNDPPGAKIKTDHDQPPKIKTKADQQNNPTICFKEASPPKFNLERKVVSKVPTVASEKELQAILEARSNGVKQRMKSLDPRKARALRRKLYLDLYGEVAQRMLI